jgi:hypothetical protein
MPGSGHKRRRPTANCDSGHSATRGIVLNLDQVNRGPGRQESKMSYAFLAIEFGFYALGLTTLGRNSQVCLVSSDSDGREG